MIIKKDFQYKGLSLSYLEKDNLSDSSIVFLHGLNNRKEYYLDLMQRIDTHNCFALDFRGHGDSTSKGEFSLEAFSDDVQAFISHLNIVSNFYVVASSLAAWVISSIEGDFSAKGIFFLDAGYYTPSLETGEMDTLITLPTFSSFNQLNQIIKEELLELENEQIYLDSNTKQFVYNSLAGIYKMEGLEDLSYQFILNEEQLNSLLQSLQKKDNKIIENDNLNLILARSKRVKSRLLCKMLYNVFTISTYQN